MIYLDRIKNLSKEKYKVLVDKEHMVAIKTYKTQKIIIVYPFLRQMGRFKVKSNVHL